MISRNLNGNTLVHAKQNGVKFDCAEMKFRLFQTEWLILLTDFGLFKHIYFKE